MAPCVAGAQRACSPTWQLCIAVTPATGSRRLCSASAAPARVDVAVRVLPSGRAATPPDPASSIRARDIAAIEQANSATRRPNRRATHRPFPGQWANGGSFDTATRSTRCSAKRMLGAACSVTCRTTDSYGSPRLVRPADSPRRPVRNSRTRIQPCSSVRTACDGRRRACDGRRSPVTPSRRSHRPRAQALVVRAARSDGVLGVRHPVGSVHRRRDRPTLADRQRVVRRCWARSAGRRTTHLRRASNRHR
jgi:hypothetical protein